MTEGGCSTSEDGAKCCCTAHIISMTTFFESSDLMRHMFNCIEKGDRQHATLVCKQWKDVSYTMPTWRRVRLSVVRVDGPHMEPLVPDYPEHSSLVSFEVSILTLKGILAERKHVVRFALRCQDLASLADLATSMAHVQWLQLSVNMRDGEENEENEKNEENDKGEMEPFRMDGLPSLTFLGLPRNIDRLPTSVALHLPPLLSLNQSVFGASNGLNLQCPKLETLAFGVMRGMVIAPSLFSNLRSLKATFHTIPDSMLDGNGTELVLGACPRLTSLSFKLFVENSIITSLALDLPSLRHLTLRRTSLTLSEVTLRLTCPNLAHVDLRDFRRLSLPPTLMAQLTRFSGEVEQMVTRHTHKNEANHRHVIEGWPVLEILSLQGCAVDVTLVCPSLRDLSINRMYELKTCKVVSPVLSDLNVEYCPRLDVSSMIQPSLENVVLHKCNLEEGTEWTLPNLRHLDLSDVKTTHIMVNYAPPSSDGVDGGGQVHQLSVDWKNKRQDWNDWEFRGRGILLGVSKEKDCALSLSLDAKDCSTKLRIVAPSATKLHLKRCGALKELDIDSRLLLELVVGNFPAKIRKMVARFSHKCPCLEKVTFEI